MKNNLFLLAFLLLHLTMNAQHWVARHALNGANYQTEFDKWTKQGYSPVVVSGYVDGNQDRYAVVFEKPNSAPTLVARHGLTSAAYQAEVDKWTKQGYRPVQVTGNNLDHYTAILKKLPMRPLGLLDTV